MTGKNDKTVLLKPLKGPQRRNVRDAMFRRDSSNPGLTLGIDQVEN
jgi:hypothetical protein